MPRPGVDWPSFRGIRANGVSDGHPAAAEWDVAAGKNVLWKTPLPGLAHACPIIWGNTVYAVSAASSKGDDPLKVGLYGDIASVEDDAPQRWTLYALDKRSGKILWQQLIHEGVPQIKRHTKASHANSTPATDGEHIVVMLGSEGLFCFDADGKKLWKVDLGRLDSGYYMVPAAQWGFASSPIIHGDKVIMECDIQQKKGFLAAFSIADGKELWRTPREDVPTWSSPTIVESPGRTQIVCNGCQRMAGYDLETGKELWWLRGGGDIPVPTPVTTNGLIYIASAHGYAAPLFAVKADANGEVSLRAGEVASEAIPWSEPKNAAYMQTPLIYRGQLYSCRDNGVLNVYDPATGKNIYRQRLGSGSTGFTASPVAADGKIYFTSEEGDVLLVEAAKEYKLLATNALGETCMASPAVSEGVLYFRTRGHVVAIGAAREGGGHGE